MDELDTQIIELLKKNARIPFVDVGKRLNVSEGTVRGRVQKLVDSGVIRQFTIKTANKNVEAMVDVKIKVNVNTSNVAERISKIRGVERIYEVSGDHDIVVVIDVMSTNELNNIIEEIRKLSDTLSTHTRLILKEW